MENDDEHSRINRNARKSIETKRKSIIFVGVCGWIVNSIQISDENKQIEPAQRTSKRRDIFFVESIELWNQLGGITSYQIQLLKPDTIVSPKNEIYEIETTTDAQNEL